MTSPKCELESLLVDAAAARLVLDPGSIDVLVASNLHGDILSDLTGALAGSLGMAPSANLHLDGRFPSMFEPVHGSALDLVGRGIANPIGAILSAAMMLDELGSATNRGAGPRRRRGDLRGRHLHPRRRWRGNERAGRRRGHRRHPGPARSDRRGAAMSSATTGVIAGLYIDGVRSVGSGKETREIRSPYDGALLAVVPEATREDVDRAAAAAERAFREAPLTPFERYEILSGTAALVRERAEELARLIVAEAGKPIRDARGEVARAVQTITLCAEEAKRVEGEVVPFEATPGSEHRVGFTLSPPVGPVCAISPFNAPLNQMNHKVPTAIAAGCTVVLKPAEITPLSAIELVRMMAEAGLPAGHLNLVLGAGETVGQWLLEDERFAAYSFTGSVAVGKHIRRTVGLRKTLLELGNSSANIVHADADLALAASAIAKSAYAYAGQLCISAQRLLVHAAILDEFVELLVERVRGLQVGDPGREETDVGPMIDEAAAERAERLIDATVSAGARLVDRRRAPWAASSIRLCCSTSRPRCRSHARRPLRRWRRCSPTAGSRRRPSSPTPLAYGLQAAVFTESIDVAFYLARRIEVGAMLVNEGSHFRIDQMPFGGVKDSGVGREGVKYAIAEFTAPRLVAFTLKPPRDSFGPR